MTLRQVAEKSLEIYAAHEEAAGYDADYDAGEFSGPAQGRAADRKTTALAVTHGFTTEQIDAEVSLICHEADAAADHLENYA